MRIETVYNRDVDSARIGQQGGRIDGTVPLYYSNCHGMQGPSESLEGRSGAVVEYRSEFGTRLLFIVSDCKQGIVALVTKVKRMQRWWYLVPA